MPMSSHLLERGIALSKSGQKAQARRIFHVLVQNDQCNQSAWNWYLDSLDTDQDKLAALETYVTVFPEQRTARKALETLRAQLAPPAPKPVDRGAPIRMAEPPQRPQPLAVPQIQRLKPARFSGLAILLVFLGVALLGSSILAVRYVSLQSSYSALDASHRQVLQNFDQLQRNYGELSSQHAVVKAAYLGLTDQFNALSDQFTSLRADHAALQSQYDSLSSDYDELSKTYKALSQNYTTLQNTAIKPPYIVIHDRLVDTTFYDTDGTLITWETPFSGLEYDIENGANMRRSIVDGESQTVVVTTQDGTALQIRDFSLFITPKTFSKVIPSLYARSSSPHEFIYRLWHIIGQLSHYASETTETPRYPLETFLAGGGDCEDLSILLVSMIRAAPTDWYSDLVYVDSKSLHYPVDPDHVVVYINTGQQSFIVETTENTVMLPYQDGVTGWLAKDLQSGKHDIYPVSLPQSAGY